MSAAPNLEPIFRVIEGGLEVAKDSTTEVIADNGAKIVDIFTREAVAGNGTTAEVAEIVNIAEGASTGTTEGVALLTQPIQGVAVPAIAVGLGVVAGVQLGNILYDLSPEFWTDLSDALFEAGATVKGKLVAFMDNTGKTSYPQSAIEIVKNALLEAGVFDSKWTANYPASANIIVEGVDSGAYYAGTVTQEVYNSNAQKFVFQNVVNTNYNGGTLTKFQGIYADRTGAQTYDADFVLIAKTGENSYTGYVFFDTDRVGYYPTNQFNCSYMYALQTGGYATTVLQWRYTKYYFVQYGNKKFLQIPISASNFTILTSDATEIVSNASASLFAAIALTASQSRKNVQDGATIPTGDPFPTTYPSWQPASKPTAPVTYPVSQPSPNGTQPQTQTGLNPDPTQQGELSDYFYAPEPLPAPEIEPDPSPQPQPEPEPIPEPEPTPETDPSDPNPDPEGSGSTPALPPVATTPSSALFTVYNPTDGELDNLGAFLWSSSIIDNLKKIWQNPLDGIIALHKVYATPTTGGTQNIILGYVDSEVSASVVTGQFVTVDCGSVTVPENKQNATDYSPFTQLQIYLPFVGIQELDTNEIMNGSVNVKYKIDLYTGTCLAMVFVTRSPDKENAQLLYTFSGNCSQQIPLTASNFSGAIASLLGIVGVGVASGGALGAVAGMGAIAHSLTHEMVHIQHSGGLSANSGILAPRKPFIIISRQYGYDANNYNQIYGFPANKTVYLSNCKDFVRVKAVNYKGRGTETEKQMIKDALKGGVLV